MAVRIPDQYALGRAPGIQVARRTPPAVHSAMELAGPSVGQAAEKIGAIFEKRENDAEAFKTQADFIDFRDQQQKALLEKQRGAAPGAAGFTQGIEGDYYVSARDFLKTVPRRLRPEYDVRLALLQSDITTAADKFEAQEGKRFDVGRIGDATDKLAIGASQNPSDVTAKVNEAYGLIDASTRLTAPEKEAEKRKIREKISVAGAKGLIDSDQEAARQWSRAGFAPTPQGYSRWVSSGESGGDPQIVNKASGAYGKYQFIPSTLEALRKIPELDLPASGPLTEEQQDRAFNYFTQQNANALRSALGRNPTPVELRMAHFFGPGGASRLLRMPADTKFDDVPDQVWGGPSTATVLAQNPNLKGKTIGSLTGQYDREWSRISGQPAPAGQSPEGRQFVVPEGIGYDSYLKLRSYADARLKEQQAAETKAYASYKDKFELGIATNNIPSADYILSDKILKDGDKASLINLWNTKFKDERFADQATGEYLDALRGQGVKPSYNPLTEGDRKKVDAIGKRLQINPADVLNDDSPSNALAKELYRNTNGGMPKDIVARIRQGLDSKDASEVEKAATLAAWMNTTNPAGLDAATNGEDIRKAAEKFTAYRDRLGYSSTEAARMMIEARSPDRKVTAEALKKPLEDELKKIDIGDVRRSLGQTGILPGASSVLSSMTLGLLGSSRATDGFNEQQTAEAVADYKAFFQDAYLEHGNAARAKAEADIRMSRLYGVTTVGGTPRLMKYPPERFYPPVNGSHDYIASQALADIKQATGKDVGTGDIMLVPDANTAREARARDAGAPSLPGYRLYYMTTENGQKILQRAPGDFVPDYRAAADEDFTRQYARFKAEQAQIQAASQARATATQAGKPGRDLAVTDMQRAEAEAIRKAEEDAAIEWAARSRELYRAGQAGLPRTWLPPATIGNGTGIPPQGRRTRQ